MDADLAQAPALAQRLVVLADLVALGQVGIEVVLAMEDRPWRKLGAHGEADHQAVVDRPLVGQRQRPGQAEADRAGEGVRRLAEGQRAAAEHLRRGGELDVNLQADDGLVLDLVLAHRVRPALPSNPIARSSANAASRIRFSLNAGPAS